MECAIYLFVAFALAFFVGTALACSGPMADEHAEECFRDTAEQRTKFVIDTVRRQQLEARSWNAHRRTSQEFCRVDPCWQKQLDEWKSVLQMDGVAG